MDQDLPSEWGGDCVYFRDQGTEQTDRLYCKNCEDASYRVFRENCCYCKEEVVNSGTEEVESFDLGYCPNDLTGDSTERWYCMNCDCQDRTNDAAGYGEAPAGQGYRQCDGTEGTSSSQTRRTYYGYDQEEFAAYSESTNAGGCRRQCFDGAGYFAAMKSEPLGGVINGPSIEACAPSLPPFPPGMAPVPPPPSPSPPPPEVSCVTSSWPHVKDGVTCSSCKVLVDQISEVYEGTCENYCASVGRSCVGAYEDDNDTCNSDKSSGAEGGGNFACDEVIVGRDDKDSNDALCECSATEASREAPTCDVYTNEFCEASTWPDTSMVCGACKAHVHAFSEGWHEDSGRRYGGTCAGYCHAISGGRYPCVGAWAAVPDWEEALAGEHPPAPHDICSEDWSRPITCDTYLNQDDAICECACGGESWAYLEGDPHLFGADGDRADFRGDDHAVYNVLSARDLSLSVRLEHSDYTSPYSKQLIHGSWVRAAFWVIRTRRSHSLLKISWEARVDRAYLELLNGTSGKTQHIELPKHMREPFHVDGVRIERTKSTLTVKTPRWLTYVKKEWWNPHPNILRMNIKIHPTRATARDAVAPHGLLGQTYDRDRAALSGRTDSYTKRPKGSPQELFTRASAEGAIEGEPNDYKLASPFATAFRFSRFDATRASPRNATAIKLAHAEIHKPPTPVPKYNASGGLHNLAVGVNFQGHDLYGGKGATTPAECYAACERTEGCAAFTFITAAPPKSKGRFFKPCWLKSVEYHKGVAYSGGTVSGILAVQ